jgi:hypothetical protein
MGADGAGENGMAAITWTGAAGDGNFNNPMNWSPPQVPGASDTVTISPSAATLINVSQNDAVATLATSNLVTLSINDGSSFTVGNTNIANAALTNAGTITINATNYATGLVIGSSEVTLSGGGTIAMGNSAGNYIDGAAASDILDNTGNTILGGGSLGNGQLTFINGAAGVVDATLATQLVLNTGTIAIANAGLLEATAGNGLVIDSNVTNASAGHIVAGGGNVILANGADIAGGALSSTGTSAINIGNTATLDGSTAGTLTNLGNVVVQDGSTLTLLGNIANQGAITLDSANYLTELIIGPGGNTVGTVTLSGTGTVALDGAAGDLVTGAISGDTLVNKETITGGGQLGGGTLSLVNQGTISATGSNTLFLNTGAAIINDGVLEALGTGVLDIQSVVNGSGGGTILAASAAVVLGGGTIMGGEIETTGTGVLSVSGGGNMLDGTAQAVTNAGLVSLNDNATLTLLGTITNAGTIALNAANYDTDLVAGGATVTLTGGGTILLDNTGGNRIYGAAGSDVLVNVNNLIEGAGQIGTDQLTLVNEAAGIIDANASGGMSLTSGGAAVINAGLIEATSTGGMTISTVVDSSSGGTILASGAYILLNSGTLAGGTIKTSGTGAVAVNTGTLDGSAHTLTNDGLVSVNDGGTLALLGTITNAGTIALNAANYNTDLVVSSSKLILNGGGTIALDDSAGNRIYGVSAGDVLDNVNNLIEGAGQVGAGRMTLINGSAGVIDANLGAGLTLSTGAKTATNAGLIEATSGGVLFIDTKVDSSSGGTILADGANVYLNGGTLAGGVVDTLAGGAVIVSGGGTLDGSAHTLTNEGLVYVADGETLTLLGNIANQGTISLNNADYNTDLIVGSAGVTLSGSGTILLGAGGGNRIYGSTATNVLNNVGNTIEGSGQVGVGALTLVNSALIEATGSNALVINLGSTGMNTATGEMLAVGAGGLVFQNGTYTNLGLIQADNGSSVTFQSGAVLTNDANGTLTGGAYAAIDTGNDATLSITGSAVTTLAADITLSGAGSSIEFGGTLLEQSLSSITAAGTLNILADRNFDATANGGTFTDNGLLTLGGGTFTASSVTVGAGAFLNGFGVIDGAVVNDGTITVEGGALIFDGPLTGDGTLTTGTGGIVELMGGGSLNQGVTGNGTLELQSGSFTIADTEVTIADLDIDANTSLSGNGTITSNTVDAGTLQAIGGTLTLDGALSGAGTLAAGSGAVLIEAGGGKFGGTIMGQGTVFIDTATTFLSGINLDVGTLDDSANLTLSAGADITNHAGDVFMLTATNPGARHREQIKIGGGKANIFTNAGTLMAETNALIDVSFANSGEVSVQAGTFTLARALTGNGGFAVAANATVDLTGKASFAGAFTGAGTVRFDAAAKLEPGASIGVANVIDTALITLGSGESLTNANGNIFSMTNTGALDTRHRAQVEVKGGHGDSFTNAGTITADAATQSFAVSVVNSGLVSASSGTLAFLGAIKNTGVMNATGAEISASKCVSGAGSLDIGTGGTMALLNGAAAGQTTDFLSGAGSLDLGNPLNFLGTIDGFAGSAVIDLLNTAETGYNFAGGVLTVTDGSTTVANLHFGGSYTNADFAFGSDGHGGTLITFK